MEKTITKENAKVTYDSETLIAYGYVGKSKKTKWACRFQSKENMDEYIDTFFKKQEELRKFKEEEKNRRKVLKEKKAENIKVGDILTGSWGWEQTNVEAYQVIDKPAKFTVVLREINVESVKDSTLSHGMADHVLPVKDSFVKGSEPIKKRIGNYGNIKINSIISLSKWDGRKMYRSWYA